MSVRFLVANKVCVHQQKDSDDFFYNFNSSSTVAHLNCIIYTKRIVFYIYGYWYLKVGL